MRGDVWVIFHTQVKVNNGVATLLLGLFGALKLVTLTLALQFLLKQRLL